MAITQVKVNSTINSTFRVDVQASHDFVIDQPKAAGGNNEGPNPLEIFLSSLSACICTLGKIIAMQQKLDVRSIEAIVEGDIDKDFLMGMTSEGRAGFTEIRSFVKIDSDMSDEEKNNFLHEIERRCPIADNMAFSTNLKAEVIA